MSSCARLLLLLVIFTANLAPARAQDPKLVEANLAFSRQIVAHYHLWASVSLESGENKYTQFQYDRYPTKPDDPGVERIKCEEGVYARIGVGTGAGPWLKSDDWGTTGTAVGPELSQKLDYDADVANVAFQPSEDRDSSQGAPVWKLISKTPSKDGKHVDYTYERSRERPHPNGVYPRYTFSKWPQDKDGQLFISGITAQLRSGDKRVPFWASYTYFIPLAQMPAGTTVKYSHNGHVVDTEIVKPDGTVTDTPGDAAKSAPATNSTPTAH